MRNVLSRRKRDESGAIAILVGILSIFLIGMVAFVADVGLAYANKRQMQTAVDAATTAAVGVYATQPGDCAALSTVGSAPYNAALAEANAKLTANSYSTAPASFVPGSYSVTCEPEGLVVRAEAATDSPSIFGKVFGLNEYAVSRPAAAVLDVPEGVTMGVRPLAVCSKELNSYTGPSPSKVLMLSQPGQTHASSNCPDANTSGNWWTFRCPGTSGASAMIDAVTNGCDAPLTVVPNQPDSGPVDLANHLRSYCFGSNPPIESLSLIHI